MPFTVRTHRSQLPRTGLALGGIGIGTGWEHHHPYYERALREFPLPEADDTGGRNQKNPETGATLAGERLSHRFALAWHFPNLHERLIRNDPHSINDHPSGARLALLVGEFRPTVIEVQVPGPVSLWGFDPSYISESTGGISRFPINPNPE